MTQIKSNRDQSDVATYTYMTDTSPRRVAADLTARETRYCASADHALRAQDESWWLAQAHLPSIEIDGTPLIERARCRACLQAVSRYASAYRLQIALGAYRAE